ncbi:hypothetical protein PVAND_000558 [Polypedilum vanderplanki]|uniref:Uncharacterized protein n=1 Tax=Polypedilum vanderplanki TaxID=319348 RepID=A0A9J6BK63_POLVA|nr:hypothetical protein PVAND_000558 [Polypedilum vanderplanki]
MKNERVVPNYKVMLESSFTLLALVACGWLLIKLVSACFYLPRMLKKWELEEKNHVINELLKEKEELEAKKNETSESQEITTDSEKSKDDFEKISEIEEEEVDNDATKKNK